MRDYTGLRAREWRVVEGISVVEVGKVVFPLFLAFILLNFADALTTMVAFRTGPHFVELNTYASVLFAMGFRGFMYAYFLKLVPTAPLFYVVFVRETDEFEVQVRLLKFVAFVVLVAADIYLGFIVLGNNLPTLLASIS